MRLIDADKIPWCNYDLEHYHSFVGVDKEYVDEMPAIDAVEVIRCKDCIHYELGVCLKIYDDGTFNADAWQERKPDDFCSYGKKKWMETEGEYADGDDIPLLFADMEEIIDATD